MEESNPRKMYGIQPPQTTPNEGSFLDPRLPTMDNSQQPIFPSSWNQFSGMPSHDTSNNTFHWDTFTPPNTPAFGASYPGMNAETEYLSQILSNIRNNPSSINPDPRLADQSATGGLYYPDAGVEGHELYLETLREWSSSASVSNDYDPFNSPDILQQPVSPDSLDPKESASSKPSYSEIAKSLKSKPMQINKEKEDQQVKKKIPDPPLIKQQQFKPIRKSHIHRQFSKGQKNSSYDMESKVSPDSKYGLDSFEEVDNSGSSIDKIKSDSVESIPLLSRKGSTSSVSSGTSGIEEIHLTKPPPSSYIKKECSSKKSSNGSQGIYSESASEKKLHHDKAFFDPRRIFQNKSTTKTTPCSKFSSSDSNATSKVISGSKFSTDDSATTTVLNNGKPAGHSKPTTSNHRKSTDYINNDLRDENKKSNQSSTKVEGSKRENVTNGKVERKNKHPSVDNHGSGRRKNRNQMSMNSTFDQEYIDEWINYMYNKAKAVLKSAWSGLVALILLLLGLIVYIVSGCVRLSIFVWHHVSNFIRIKILQKYFSKYIHIIPEPQTQIGLDANITLPTTGHEAMQRLLACKGKDPYSILGLKHDATDDDIRRYYRKQAVLVHPDKNTQPGAEESFKILGHAFELIGESEKRKAYDSKLAEAHQAEAAMKDFNDLLTKLQNKIQEAANMMRCDNCGGKHKRIPVDRPWYSARFCKRCNIRHSAKEGDVWAETSVFGFLWHYYACMEGKIYDITEWVSCKKDYFKHMQASAHHVFYRIATEGGRNNNQQGRSGEADLENFINHLFHQAMNTEQGAGNQWQPPQQQSQTASNQNWSSTTASKKTSRRRKKKH